MGAWLGDHGALMGLQVALAEVRCQARFGVDKNVVGIWLASGSLASVR